MAARSTISIKNEDGSIDQIYCHWNGYSEGVGKTLVLHYKDVEKIYDLIELGDVSSLGKEIGEKHNFNHRPENVTTFYGRDRGEPDTVAFHFEDWDDFLRNSDKQDYNYVYIDDEWKLLDKDSLSVYDVNYPKR